MSIYIGLIMVNSYATILALFVGVTLELPLRLDNVSGIVVVRLL